MFANIASGFREQGEKDGRKRREIAQAFQDFKSANPEATAREFQSFIDQISEGRNYLRGGAPSGQVLEQIGAANAQAKAQRLATERLSQARARSEFRGQLEAQIDDALLNMTDEDYGGAMLAFTEELGGDLGGIDVRGMFTPARRARAIQARAAQAYPMASQMIKDANGELEPGALAKATGLPLAVAEAVTKRYKSDADREQQVYLQRNRGELINAGVAALDEGLDPVAAITALAGETGVALPKEYLDSLAAEAQRRKQQAAQDRERELGREMNTKRVAALDFLQEQMTSDGPALNNQQMAEHLAFFFGIEAGDIPQATLQSYQQAFQQRQAKIADERKREQDQVIATAKQTVMGPLLEPGRLTHFAEAPDARAAILREVDLHISQFLTPEQQAAITPADRDAIFKRVLEEAQINQDRAIETRRNEARVAGTEAVQRVTEESQTFVEEQMIRNMPTEQAKAAALVLGDKFYMDARAQQVLLDAFAAQDGPKTAAEFEQIGAQALKNAMVPTLTDAQNDAEEMAFRKQGAVETDLPWAGPNGYLTGAADNVKDMTNFMRGEISKAMNISDPMARVAYLEAVAIGVENGEKTLLEGFGHDMQNATRILTVGEGHWDNQQFEAQVIGPLKSSKAKLLAEIERLVANTKKVAAQTAAMDATAIPASAAEPETVRSGSSPAQRLMDGPVATANNNLLINEAALPYRANGGGAAPTNLLEGVLSLFTDDSVRARNRMVADFVDDKGLRDQMLKAIEEDREVLHAFQADPATFIETSDLPFIKAWREKKAK